MKDIKSNKFLIYLINGQAQNNQFYGNEKRSKRMALLTLPMYHPLLREQIILATIYCDCENKDNCELF